MAALFVCGVLGASNTNSVRAGLRIYFGQRDKTLMDRSRQDDPTTYFPLDEVGRLFLADIEKEERLRAALAPVFPGSSFSVIPGSLTVLAGTRSDRRCLIERSGFGVRCR
jgi:hypothetical protein